MTEGENMLERIARVQFETWNWSEDDGGNPMAFDDLGQDWRDAYFKVARAVIEALMKPTPEMVSFGIDAMSRDDLEPTEDEFRAGFVAALRTASRLSNKGNKE